jgi:hypothetical protein
MLKTLPMADVSTSHITRNDSTLLELAAQADVNTPTHPDDFPLRVYATTYGFVVFCRDIGIMHETIASLKAHEMSEAFCALYALALQEGVFAINLDCDAETYNGLEKFDW